MASWVKFPQVCFRKIIFQKKAARGGACSRAAPTSLLSFAGVLGGIVLRFAGRHLRDAARGAPQATGELSWANLSRGGDMSAFRVQTTLSSETTWSTGSTLHTTRLPHSYALVLNTHTPASPDWSWSSASHLLWFPCPHHDQLPVLQSHQYVAELLGDGHAPHRNPQGQRCDQSIQAAEQRGVRASMQSERSRGQPAAS